MSIIFGRNFAKKFNEKTNNQNEIKEESKLYNISEEEEYYYDDDDYYYSGSNNSSSSYSGGTLTLPQSLIVIGIVVVSIAIPLTFYYCQYRAQKKRDNSRTNVSYEVDIRGMVVDDDLNMQVYLLYKQINDAWMKKDLDPVRHLLTDELYNMYLMQLDTLIESNQTNIMKDYSFISGSIEGWRIVNGKEYVSMFLKIRCKDYIVNEKNKINSNFNNGFNWNNSRII